MKIPEKKYLQPILIGITALINIILWVVPSNIAKLIAKDRYIFLGRYSIEKLTLLFFLIPISLTIIYIILAPTKRKLKLRIFQVVAALMVLVPGTLIVDVVLRLKQSARYVKTDEVYHRPPSKVYNIKINDKPSKTSTYKQGVDTYPAYDCQLTSDKQGFRNIGELKKQYDIVTIGDSFTEGSDVTDDQIWAATLSKKSGMSLYNIGMSGTDPIDYLKTFKKFGLNLKPKIVICMIYEGNDFRASGRPEDRMRCDNLKEPSFSKWLKSCRRSSPILNNVRAFMEKTFVGSVTVVKDGPKPAPKKRNDDKKQLLKSSDKEPLPAPTAISKALGWLPLKVPQNNNIKYYNFPPKKVVEFYTTKEKFIKSKGWANVKYALNHLNKICRDNQIRLIVTYAPCKPSIVIPIAKDYIAAESLHSFVSLKRSGLPKPDLFKTSLLESVGLIQSIVENYCSQNRIDFIDIYKPLYEETARGNQTYFTYDQHWSPDGHKVVSDTIYNYLIIE